MKKVICISGKAQHGKDTSANMLKETLETKGHKVLIVHYGDLLKFLCKSYFGWNGEKDDAGRTLLQYVGTDVVRTKEPNYWVKFVTEFLTLFAEEWDYVIIPDCRFPNEIKYIAKHFPYMHVRVVRPNFVSPLTEEQQQHISETALDNYEYDCLLDNNGTLESLNSSVETFAQLLK